MKERPPKRFYEFDSFRIDVDERQLTRNGVKVAVTPKVFDILLTLIENRGHTVPKEEFLDQVWGNTYVYEGNLSRNISTLRQAIEDDSHEPKFITTIPRRGYRFDGEVREILQEEDEQIVERRTNYRLSIQESSSVETQIGDPRRLVWTAGTIAFVAIAIGSLWMLNPGNWRGAFTAFREDKEEALALYQKGRVLWETRAPEDLHNATLMLEQAVLKDPKLAIAHAALADAYAFDYINWRKAEAAANEATRLDPQLAPPHATIGFVRTFWEWDPTSAEDNFKRAIALDPNYTQAHQWYAISLAIRQRAGLGLAEIKKAAELKPGSASVLSDMCQILYFHRKFDLAQDQCRKALAVDPNSLGARNNLYDLLSVMRFHDNAFTEFEQIAAANALPSIQIEKLRTAFANGGMPGFWQARIEMLKRGEANEFHIARYYALLGEKEEAIKWLGEAKERRNFNFLFVGADPVFDPLIGDPRFEQLESVFVGPQLAANN